MKEIKVTESVEKVVAYEAIDGTRFNDKDECLKYDNTAGAVIKAEFKKRVLNVVEVSKLTSCGDVPLSECGEDWYVAIVRINNQEDLHACNMFSQFDRQKNLFTDEMIGKDILVSVGDGDSQGNSYYNNCYPYGTIDDCIDKYRKGLMKVYESTDTEQKG